MDLSGVVLDEVEDLLVGQETAQEEVLHQRGELDVVLRDDAQVLILQEAHHLRGFVVLVVVVVLGRSIDLIGLLRLASFEVGVVGVVASTPPLERLVPRCGQSHHGDDPLLHDSRAILRSSLRDSDPRSRLSMHRRPRPRSRRGRGFGWG
jgi:hypothetical protein